MVIFESRDIIISLKAIDYSIFCYSFPTVELHFIIRVITRCQRDLDYSRSNELWSLGGSDNNVLPHNILISYKALDNFLWICHLFTLILYRHFTTWTIDNEYKLLTT